VEGVLDYPKASKWAWNEYTAVRNSYKVKKEKCLLGDFQIYSETPTQSRVLIPSNRPANWIFMVYNGKISKLVMFVLAIQNTFCVDKMTPGSTYQLCVAPEDCQNSWSCKSFTTFVKESSSPSLYDLNVTTEGKDHNWIQLSWPPPKIKRPLSPPVGYIVLVTNPESCLEKTVYYQAPWVTETESLQIIKRSSELSLNRGCFGKSAAPTEGKLDGYWPDFPGSRRSTWVNGWNTAEVDEQGPIGLFAVTIDNLQAHKAYQFEIHPVVYPAIDVVLRPATITASTSAIDSEVRIESRGDNVKINSRSYTNFVVSEIGAFSIHCEQNRPIYKNGAAERLCNKSDNIVINDLVIPLTPGGMYRISIGFIEKVFQIPASKISFQPHMEAMAISSNLISLKLLNLNTAAPNPPAFITRICQTDDATYCRKEPLYVEAVGAYSLHEGRSVWRHNPSDNSFSLNAHINGTEKSNLFALLYAYYGNEEVLLYKTKVGTRKQNCKNWCIWPAGDWSNTKGRAFGVYENSFTRYSERGRQCTDKCLPLQEAIDGESGCTHKNGYQDLCNIPVCSNVAPIGCVTDTEYNAGMTWISAEWKNPRESVNPAPNYLVLVTSDSKGEPCRVYGENTNIPNLPPFIQTTVRSCSNRMSKLLSQSSVNITDLIQNTTYNIFIIPYLADGRIGAVLERSTNTRLARK
ncbi:unnamed protein product, partial [Hymenolepis diminuta]